MSKSRNRSRQKTTLAKNSGAGGIFGNPTASGGKKSGGGGGFGLGDGRAIPASGQNPQVNPFMIPKASGINVISQTYPSNYYVEWNLSTWRAACDQAIKQGYPVSYATLTNWAFECSPFIQSLFSALGSALDKVKFFVCDQKGKPIDELTAEWCNKPWCMQIRREIIFSFFWGFTGINFDPFNGKVYKYPMQDIDPINRMLRQGTFAFYDGIRFDDCDNLLFVQPSTNYESFLGWMQPITRSFIQMNMANNNWLAAGMRLAFPLMTIGYPQNDGAIDPLTNLPVNQAKIEAENIAANIDPSKATVYPYTKDINGNIQKAIEIDFEKTGTGANMHKIYQEFNSEQKSEIEQLILGGTLTSSAGKNGSRALGEVQERKLDTVMSGLTEFCLAVLSYDLLPKLTKFYKNVPNGVRFDYDRTKILSIEDLQKLSAVMVENGYKFTDQFFEAQGVNKDFFEPGPVKPEPAPSSEALSASVATHLSVKKKY